MDIEGQYSINAPREQVWAALNDPAVLKTCIPGCESLEMTSETDVSARIASKIGPVKAKFDTKITLSDMNPPISYTISGEGKGGVAGFGRGSAHISLEEQAQGTQLTYKADLKVGGKLAQVGSRLVVGVTRKIADDFFDTFAAQLNAEAPQNEDDGAATVAPAGIAVGNAGSADESGGKMPIWLIAAALAGAVALWWLLRQ